MKERIAPVTYDHFERMGFRWFCLDCTPKISDLSSNCENKIIKEIKYLSERIEGIEKRLPPSESTPTYASIAKSETERTLVITHDDKKVTSRKIANIVSTNFDPVLQKVSSLHVLKNKCVLKTKLDEKKFDSFAKAIKNHIGDGCDAKPMKKRKPRLKILGCLNIERNKYTDEKIIELLRKQNNFIQDDDEIRIVKKEDARAGNIDLLIIETSPRAYRSILKAKKVLIGFFSCKVYDSNFAPRCYKCSELGHFEKNCKSPFTRCPKCCGFHKLKNCDSQVLKCINCANSFKEQDDHAAYDKNCPTAAHQARVLRSFFEDEIG